MYILIPLLVFAFVAFVFLNKLAIKGMNKAFYQNKWKEIEDIMAAQGSMGSTLAVIEADKLLDHALKEKNFSGKSMGERMKSANTSLVNRNDVWEAHKLRNKLVHEQDVKLGKKQAKVALAAFKKALKGLGAL